MTVMSCLVSILLCALFWMVAIDDFFRALGILLAARRRTSILVVGGSHPVENRSDHRLNDACNPINVDSI